ncbi:tetratricopeptide repeat protein [Legionella israelensis]|uniref:TPR repeat containing protein n=1 Tax=Legionella israelensis TaxID=454 RepID=A0A0W0WQI4_9GAMM|nr:tetratricopeptide repeat protein [Legionella israelensis]KTD34579.1 TPR repeat containing protein [Legionella israelensis]QBS09500.1 tetratricopeptide repeat protein [Legionella israelensis]SCX99859.1 Ca-activated chloride channel family protein [Legionella israelensis DSM 19235]STX60413.1 TPR repeat containing protein [Legionella israelensis]
MRYRLCLLFLLILPSSLTHALSWKDVWLTPDQQAEKMMEKGRFKQAENTFKRKDWSAVAAYRSGNYEQAAQWFGEQRSVEGYYNQGNALAHMGKYEEALQAYDKALNIEPDHQDALYNRKIVVDLLNKEKEKKKQEEQQDKQQQDKQQQNKQQQNKQQQNKQQQNKQQQDKQQQDRQQQNKQQQNKQQQNKQQQNKQQQNKQQQDKQQQDKQQQDKQQQDKPLKNTMNQVATQSAAEREKQQAKEQWLRVIPDDPGGLMREKFLRDHLRRQRGWYQ